MIQEEKTPQIQVIYNSLSRLDYADTFSVTNHENSLEEITILVLGQAPDWIKSLFQLRNYLVRLVGIQPISKPEVIIDYKVGGSIVFFDIYKIENNFVLLGKNDKHLDFRVCISNSNEEKQNIKVTTVVQFHNAKGKLYFSVIKPFHKMIVRSMVKNAIPR